MFRNVRTIGYIIFGGLVAICTCIPVFHTVLADSESSETDIEFQVGVNVCGDGLVDPGESCDDGNASNTDGCLNSCELASCGDGFIEVGEEECDDGGGNGTCSEDATCSNSCAILDCDDNPQPPTPTVDIQIVTPGYTTIDLFWTAYGGTIVSCEVDWGTAPGMYTATSTEYAPDGIGYSSTLTGLEQDTTYFIRVTCTNGDNNSGSDTTVTKTLDNPTSSSDTVRVIALPELRDTTPYDHKNLDFVVRFFDPGTGLEIPGTSFSGTTNDDMGVYEGVHTVPVGEDLIAEIKGLSHLSKRIVGVNTTGGTIVLDFTDGGVTKLRAGDVRTKGETNPLPMYTGKNIRNDDIIEGADLSIMLSYFGTTGAEAYEILDFNRDGAAIDYYITEGSELSTILSRFGTIQTY